VFSGLDEERYLVQAAPRKKEKSNKILLPKLERLRKIDFLIS